MDWLSRAAAERPAAPALILPDRTISYSELDRAADGAASIVVGGGFDGLPVALAGDPTEITAAALWGIPRARSTAVILDPRLPPAEAMRMTRAAGARGLFGPLEGGFDRLLSRGGLDLPGWGPPHDEAAFVVLTSGSEGRRKGVVITGANVAAAVTGSRARLGNGPDDEWLCVLPLFHVGGASILWRQADATAPVRLPGAFDPRAVSSLIGVSALTSMVPTMLERVLDAGAKGPTTVLVGGGPVPPSLIERAQATGMTALQTYGMTETTSQVCTVAPADVMSDLGTAGRPIDGAEVRVVVDGRPVVGMEGRIEVRGAMVSPGYVGETARPSSAWFTTGDRGRVDLAGRLTVLGRADDVIVTGGENVDPVTVERELLRHPAVLDARVFGEPDETWGTRVVAEAILDGATVEEVLAWSRGRLTAAQVPKELRVVRVLGEEPE